MPVLGKGFMGMKTPSPLMACSLAVGSHIVIGTSIGGFIKYLDIKLKFTG